MILHLNLVMHLREEWFTATTEHWPTGGRERIEVADATIFQACLAGFENSTIIRENALTILLGEASGRDVPGHTEEACLTCR